MHLFSGSSQVQSCVFTGNGAQLGAGLHLDLPTAAAVANSVFFQNQATRDGGALWVHLHASMTVIANCSISGNSAGYRGGGVYEAHNGYYALGLHNSMLWGNSAALGSPQIYGMRVHCCTVQGGYAGTGNLSSDPLLVSPVTGDFRLYAGSPCIDSGDNASVPAGLAADLDLNQRFFDDPSTTDNGVGTAPIVDRGAYEFGSPAACPSDCDGDGVCDADEIAAGTQADINDSGVPDDCEGAASNADFDQGETALLQPGGSADPVLDPVVLATNVSGPDDGSIAAVQGDASMPGAGGYAAFGRNVTIETSLADGEFFLQISLPFTQADLGGALWSQFDLTYFDPTTSEWKLAVEGNTEGVVGMRHPVQGTTVPALSTQLGDYGVYWNPSTQRGFVWANVDHTTPFTIGPDSGNRPD